MSQERMEAARENAEKNVVDSKETETSYAIMRYWTAQDLETAQ